MRKLPDITHLQFEILRMLIEGGELSGSELRGGLRKWGWKKSAPAFYQLMSRLQDAKHVKGIDRLDTVNGFRVKRRDYKITMDGRRAAIQLHDFYAHRKPGLVLGG